MLGYLPLVAVDSLVAFVSGKDGGDVVVEGDVVVVRDSTEYSASKPRATVCPGWNITNIWLPFEK